MVKMASYHKTVAFWISIMIEDSVVNSLDYNRTFETKKIKEDMYLSITENLIVGLK